jgi:Transposase IS66 family
MVSRSSYRALSWLAGSISAGANAIRVACWAHARRKFYEARHTAPLPAHQALARIGQLYQIEDAYLKDILERLPTHPADRLGELLPDVWIAVQSLAKRKAAS